MPVLIILLSQGCPTHAFNTCTSAFDYANTNAKVNASDYAYTNANAQVLLFIMPMLILKFMLMFLPMFISIYAYFTSEKQTLEQLFATGKIKKNKCIANTFNTMQLNFTQNCITTDEFRRLT